MFLLLACNAKTLNAEQPSEICTPNAELLMYKEADLVSSTVLTPLPFPSPFR